MVKRRLWIDKYKYLHMLLRLNDNNMQWIFWMKLSLVLALLGTAAFLCAFQVSQRPQQSQLPEAKAAIKLSQDGEQLLARTATKSSSRGIPKILHYVFKHHQVLNAYKPLIRSCLDLNPNWEVYLWRDSDSERLISEHYSFFLSKYRGYQDRLERSDAVRYMILHKFGGVYLDMDVLCLRPLDQLLLRDAAAFLGEERREQTRILYGYSYCAMNSMMGSPAGHPFFLEAVHQMQRMPSLNHARLTTGPDFLTKAYKSWLNCSACQSEHPVTLLPANLVSPLMDTSLVNWRQKCRPYLESPAKSEDAWRVIGCRELVNKGWQFDETNATTVAVHKFLHLGYRASNGKAAAFNMMEEFPRVKTVYP